MGKTIQIAALIHTVKPVISEEGDNPSLGVKRKHIFVDRSFKARMVESRGAASCRATLVVAPTSLLSQWAAELQRASKPGTLKVMVWHGANRANLESNIDRVDVLITSYGVLASEHSRHEGMRSGYRSPLFESM
jgi:DNA repair protein RAD5